MIVLPRGSNESIDVADEATYRREIESKRCPTCHGNAYVRVPTPGGSSVVMTCPDCSRRKR